MAERTVGPGDRVLWYDRFGQERRGRVVMRSSYPGSWVVDAGGEHGTPAVVAEAELVVYSKSKARAPWGIG